MLRDAHDAPKLAGRLPIVGHLPRLARDALGFLREARDRHGPAVWIDMGFGAKVLVVLDDEGFGLFNSGATNSSHLAEFGTFLGHSMLTVDGADHQRMRGASSRAFTPAGLSRARVGDIIAETVEGHLQRWRESGEGRLEVVPATKVIALDVIFRVMGIEVEDLPQWSRMYGEYMLGAINVPLEFPGSPAWRAARGRRWLEQRLRAIIADARAREDHDSLVGAMVHGRDDAGAGMSEVELVDNLLILGFAGHETTASTMAWSLLHLAATPSVWDRLCDEAKALDEVPTDAVALTTAAPFAVAVFRESLRLYPPVLIDTRRVHAPFEIAGYRVAPEQTVGTSLLHLSREPRRYAAPDTWRPRRWLESGRKPTPIENCQFGGGAHFCLGYHMALLEGTSFLVRAARRLSEWGLRPQLIDRRVPTPSYVPMTRPPKRARVMLA